MKNAEGKGNFRSKQTSTQKIRRHLVQDVFAEGCLKSFKVLMNTMDSQVGLSVWHFMDLLGPSRHLLHQLSLGDPPTADFYSLPGEEA